MSRFEQLSGQACFDLFPVAACVFSLPEKTITACNTAFTTVLMEPAGSTKALSWDALITIPDGVECPLCTQSAPILAHQTPLGLHRAQMMLPSGERVWVKIRHKMLSETEVLCVLEPLMEDVSVSQGHQDFVSTVSHEFRTPLTSIKGFADTILRYGEQLPADQQRRFVSIIKDQADRLTRLVENLLLVSKLGQGRLSNHFRPVAVDKLVEKVVQSLKAKYGVESPQADRVFTYSFQPNLEPAWVDPDKLEQILINLVDNAIKYSFPKTEIEIAAQMVGSNPEEIQIQVSDHGVGIPAAHLPKIFSKFARIDNPLTREVEGTGLGLYITKSLTQSLGGSIAVSSVENQGTTFTLRFPVATLERQATYRRHLVEESTA